MQFKIGQHVHYDVYPMGVDKPAIVEEMDGELVLRATGEWRDYLESVDVWPYGEVDLAYDIRACDDEHCKHRAGDAMTPRERIRHAAVERILRTHTDKDRAWAEQQLDRCIFNLEHPIPDQDYKLVIDLLVADLFGA